jgi:hypothetical protein
MFKENPAAKQHSLSDPYHGFPQYVKEALHKSWAEPFFSSIFTRIKEDRFSLLYSDNYSRPNTPVNILTGLLILKELNRWTDEELIGALYFDYRVRYALGITEFDKEKLCINTIGNFRKRLYEYTTATGRDLLREEIDQLTEALIELSGMDTSLARQDSFMISANCKNMGRLELIYSVNQNMIKLFKEKAPDSIPPGLEHYCEKKDQANQIYRLSKEEVPAKTEQLLKETLALIEATPAELQDSQAYLNLQRLSSDQISFTVEGSKPKEAKEIAADSLQNPSEPDATYRRKGNKCSTGYVLNTVEARDLDKKISMIVHHERRPNIISDVELGKGTVKSDLKGVKVLASDGAYYSKETALLAEENGLTVSFSALNGKPADPDKIGADQFTISTGDNQILACPLGFKPLKSKYDRKKEQFSAKFAKETCATCPNLGRCIVKEQRRTYAASFSLKKLTADRYRSLLGTERYQALADFRAGVEGVPSVLRRAYDIDGPPVRGLVPTSIWDHFKVMAYNFRSYYSYYQKTGQRGPSFAFILPCLKRLFCFNRPGLCYCG